MANKKVYCLCAANCKYETMTKEQILAAIAQAVSTGKITDVDTGFVTTIKEKNAGAALSFWLGTTNQYKKLTAAEKKNCFCIISDDTSIADVQAMYDVINKNVAENRDKINGSSGMVKLAESIDGETVYHDGDIRCNIRGGIVHLFGAVTISAAATTSRELSIEGNAPTLPIDSLSFYQRAQQGDKETSLMVTITPQGKINLNLSATDTKIKLYINMMYSI